MINQEIVDNPVLEESLDAEDEISPEELQPLLEAERSSDLADSDLLEAADIRIEPDSAELINATYFAEGGADTGTVMDIPDVADGNPPPRAAEAASATDPFDEIDFGSFFDDYLDPGYKSPASESVEKPSFETFLSQPQTLPDYLRSQLSIGLLDDETRDAAEIHHRQSGRRRLSDRHARRRWRSMANTRRESWMPHSRRCSRLIRPALARAICVNACCSRLKAGTAEAASRGRSFPNHMRLLETRQFKELARFWAVPRNISKSRWRESGIWIRGPDRAILGPAARTVEPDIHFIRDGDDFIIQMNDDDLPQLRLNAQYRRMLERDNGATKDVRDYVRERYSSALMLIKNIEQRKQTILKVCESIRRRQLEFLLHGIDFLRPMMIKDVAEEVGVHPSTVSRAVANKYADTPHGVYELRYFFSEAVQGPQGGDTPLLLLKRKVRKMIDEEDTKRPLTDDQITARLQAEGIQVTRRTVAKYREDLKIPSTHQRRVRE